MAHFAELESKTDPTGFTSDTHLVVKRVVVVANEVVPSDEHADGETWCVNFFGGGAWKQTSYNNNFRKQYAGPGMIYNANLDMFVGTEPDGPGWTLDSNGDWQPGPTYPTELEYEVDPSTIMPIQIYWDSSSSKWKGVKKKLNDTVLTWNSETNTWE